MRRPLAILATVLALLPSVAIAQINDSREGNGRIDITFSDRTATGASGWVDISKYGAIDHSLTFTVTGGPSGVSVALQCSNDGGVTATSTIGTNTTPTGGTITGSAVCNAVRVNVATLTGGTAPKIKAVYSGSASGTQLSVGSVDLSGAMITVGAQPANDPHFVKCSDGASASPCLVTLTGTNNVTNAGTFATQAAQSGTWTVQPGNTANTTAWLVNSQGPAAHDAVASGNPLLQGCYASAAAPTDVSADADITRQWCLRSGAAAAQITFGGVLATAGNGVAGTGVQRVTIASDSTGLLNVKLQDGSGNAIASNANSGTRGLATVIYDGAGNVVSSFGGSGGTASAFGAAFPSGASSGTAAGFSDGTNMQAGRVFDLDSGGGTQYGLGVNLRRSASGGSAELLGQGTKSVSLPVTLASDQDALPITDNGGSLTIDAPVGTPAFVRLSDGSAAITTLPVSLASVPSHAVTNAGTFATQPAGSVAHDGAASAVNPVLAGCYASAAVPTDVSADTDATRLWCLRSGAIGTQPTFAGILAVAGNGAVTTGVQRVTLANDSTGILASIGAITTSVTPGTAAGNLGKAEDAAHASGDTGIMALARRSDTAASSGGTDGDYVTINTDATGHVWTNPFPASPAAGTYLPVRLSDGSSFFAPIQSYTHDTAIGTITSATAPLNFCRASATAPSNVSADDDAVTRWCLRNGSAVTNLAAGGTLITATSTSLNVNCTGGCSGGVQYAEDIAHTSGDSVTMAGFVRRDTTPSSSCGTAGDVCVANLDANGRLYVNTTLYNSSGTELTPSTDYTHDTALGTITSVTGPAMMCRASQAAPSDVSADNDAVLQWCLRNGSPVVNLAAGGTLIASGNGAASAAVRVTLASDSTGIVSLTTSTASIGKLAANAGVNIGTVDINTTPGNVTEDAAYSEGGTLIMAGSVRRDTAASSAGTDLDSATLNTNSKGALWVSTVDPCSSETKVTDPFSLTARGVVIAATSGKKNYVCAITVLAGAAEVFNVDEGTGTTCQTGTAAIVGSTTAANGLSLAANGGFASGTGVATVMAGKTANVDTCIVPSGSNRLAGFITYVQR